MDFATTRWSRVLAARTRDGVGRRAPKEPCRLYGMPMAAITAFFVPMALVDSLLFLPLNLIHGPTGMGLAVLIVVPLVPALDVLCVVRIARCFYSSASTP